MQINPAKNITFASGLRSILRQDPDVVLVGEIRDKETMEIAFRASQTGHLVFSSLHTNSSISTITRLKDMGAEAYVVISSLKLIMAQRLVKKLCSNCRSEQDINLKEYEKYRKIIEKYKIDKLYKGLGCVKCSFTGFVGRVGIFEFLELDDKIKNMIVKGESENIIENIVKKNGMKLLVESGIEKVRSGISTFDEISKVVDLENISLIDSGSEEVQESTSVPDVGVIEKVSVEPKAADVPSSTAKKPLILVTDDEEDTRDLIESRLLVAGYDVEQASNGREAIQSAINKRPDLIIMDVMMPEINGYEATKFLKSKLETASIPIMMLTAKSDVESELKGLDMGADDYMGKPFDGSRLVARISILLKRNSK